MSISKSRIFLQTLIRRLEESDNFFHGRAPYFKTKSSTSSATLKFPLLFPPIIIITRMMYKINMLDDNFRNSRKRI